MTDIKIIQGGSHTDVRGTIHFVNEFDMSDIKRFYIIDHPSTDIVRGWRGHQTERRWFNALQGVFLIKLVKIDDFANPDPGLIQEEVILESSDHLVLQIPAGYATSLRALEAHSRIIVFADSGIENAGKDDYLFPENYFVNPGK